MKTFDEWKEIDILEEVTLSKIYTTMQDRKNTAPLYIDYWKEKINSTKRIIK